ncbi:MAG: type II secretion system protein GspM [Halioglobus sp.]
MNISIRADRSTIVVGGSLAILLVLVFYWVLHFWLLRQDFVNEIESVEPKTARLLGIMDSVEQLNIASGLASSRLQELAYGADRDSATVAAAMQQNIRELMTGAGLSISGSQILPQRKSEAFDRLSLDITAEGNIEALDAALTSLESMRPLVFIESLKISPQRDRSRGRQPAVPSDVDPRKLTARFQLLSLRLKN